MIFRRIRKKFGWYNLQKEGSKWVNKNIGSEYVDEFNEKYVSIQRGIPIGGISETIIFINLVERIKNEI